MILAKCRLPSVPLSEDKGGWRGDGSVRTPGCPTNAPVFLLHILTRRTASDGAAGPPAVT